MARAAAVPSLLLDAAAGGEPLDLAPASAAAVAAAGAAMLGAAAGAQQLRSSRTHRRATPTPARCRQQVAPAQQQQLHPASFALLSPTEQVAAGALARTVAQVAIHPLDTIKTRLQVHGSVSPQLAAWQQGFARACDALRRLDTGQLLRLAGSAGGPVGLARDLATGITGAVCTTLPAFTIFFAVDHACKHFLCARTGADPRHPLVHVGSASVAALASCFVRVPGDVLKHRVQVYRHANVVAAARHAWSHGNLFCGFGATLLRDVPEMALQFGVYEALSKAITGPPQPMLVGGVAGALAAVITTPLDTVKAQLQCQGACNAWAAMRSVAARGPAGMFAGLAPRMLQTSVQSAVFFTLFEALKGAMRQHHALEAGQQPAAGQRHQCAGWRQCAGHPPHVALAHATPMRLMLSDTRQPLRF